MIVKVTYHAKKEDVWIMDSGFSHHTKRDKTKFTNLEDYTRGFIGFGDNSTIQIKGIGTLLLNDKTPIHDVYYVDGLKYYFLSVSQICDSGYEVHFHS